MTFGALGGFLRTPKNPPGYGPGAHERYIRQTTDRRQTDGRAIAYSEREREFTFANKPKQLNPTL